MYYVHIYYISTNIPQLTVLKKNREVIYIISFISVDTEIFSFSGESEK